MSGFDEVWKIENYGETGKGGLSEAPMWADGLESCEACGAMIFPSTSFPWHWPDEDCRALKDPHTAAQWHVYATAPRWARLREDDRRFDGSRSTAGTVNGAEGWAP